LYIAHGVTTIRDAGTHLATALSERARTQADELAPSVIWGSPPIDGSPPVLPFGLGAEDADGGRALVRQLKGAGFDFIKIYDRLGADAYRAILAEARDQHIPVDGHVPLSSSPGFAVGAPADFVLLRADPRVDIRNTRQLHGVILRGRLLTRQDLD